MWGKEQRETGESGKERQEQFPFKEKVNATMPWGSYNFKYLLFGSALKQVFKNIWVCSPKICVMVLT